jgi:hypothetical protein
MEREEPAHPGKFLHQKLELTWIGEQSSTDAET